MTVKFKWQNCSFFTSICSGSRILRLHGWAHASRERNAVKSKDARRKQHHGQDNLSASLPGIDR